MPRSEQVESTCIASLHFYSKAFLWHLLCEWRHLLFSAIPQKAARKEKVMTYVITSPCIDIKDRACVDACPVDCIHDDGDEDRILYIDPVACIDCGACEPVCPVAAIFPDSKVPDEDQQFTEINQMWYEDKRRARAMVDDFKGGASQAV